MLTWHIKLYGGFTKSELYTLKKSLLHKHNCLWGEGWGSSLEEGVSYTYILKLG